MLASIINICITYNVTLKRWKRTHSGLLQKKENDIRVHRFRSINIYEADYNLVIKILVATRTIVNAERLGLPEEQWGGRKKRSAADLGLDNLLTKEYAYLSNTAMGIVDLDATACYDQIVRPIGEVALRSHGLPIHIATWMLNSLKEIKYHHVINQQVTQVTYSSQNLKAQGYGQGLSGAGTE